MGTVRELLGGKGITYGLGLKDCKLITKKGSRLANAWACRMCMACWETCTLRLRRLQHRKLGVVQGHAVHMRMKRLFRMMADQNLLGDSKKQSLQHR